MQDPMKVYFPEPLCQDHHDRIILSGQSLRGSVLEAECILISDLFHGVGPIISRRPSGPRGTIHIGALFDECHCPSLYCSQGRHCMAINIFKYRTDIGITMCFWRGKINSRGELKVHSEGLVC
jgi:hypothetical protein